MMERLSRRDRRVRGRELIEGLEARLLMSAAPFATSYAVMVMDAPQLPNNPVQVDVDIPSQTPVQSAPDNSAVDIQVRTVAGGIYLTAAVSSLVDGAPAPTGTVDFYDEAGFLGTVALSGTFRNMIVVPAGEHTFFATYSGDVNFLPSQTSGDAFLINPTTTATSATAKGTFATDTIGERVRPTRFLSETNFFTAHGMAVGASAASQSDTASTPPPGVDTSQLSLYAFAGKAKQQAAAMAIPPAGNGGLQPGDVGSPPLRFSTISFSIAVPKLRVKA